VVDLNLQLQIFFRKHEVCCKLQHHRSYPCRRASDRAGLSIKLCPMGLDRELALLYAVSLQTVQAHHRLKVQTIGK